MRRVLLAWELGGEYGHVARFLPLALEFRKRGFEPVLVLRNLCHTEQLLGGHGLTCLQAPLWISEVAGLPPPVNYAETLMRFGYLDTAGLLGVCKAWRALVALVEPALMLCDHAPTAMLATRGMDIPRAVIGTGFSVPPMLAPMPVYQWWLGAPAGRPQDSESKVLATANSVLGHLGQPLLAQLYELLEGAERFLCSSRDLDAYPTREPEARYWGSIANLEHGAPPDWPAFPGGKRIFAYLKPMDGRFEPLLKALNEVEAATLVHAPGVSGKIINSYRSARLSFSREPVRMADAARESDLIICHGGRTADVALGHGKPSLLLPMQTEQLMSSKRAEQLGVALVVTPEQPSTQIKKSLKRLLQEPGFMGHARGHAAEHPEQPQQERVSAIIDRCEALVR